MTSFTLTTAPSWVYTRRHDKRILPALHDDGITRPWALTWQSEFHEPIDARLVVTFVVDTGAFWRDLAILSKIAEKMHARTSIDDIRSLEEANPIGGIGGQVDTRKTRATLYVRRPMDNF